MIKKTLYFGNPAYLKTSQEQLLIALQDSEEIRQVPIEDIGLMVLDHPQITLTQALLAKLMTYNVAVVTCSQTHHPAGMFFNLDGNTLQSQKFQAQVDATAPLKKQLWQQTVTAKIINQSKLLCLQREDYKYLAELAKNIKSGDSENAEAKAAAYYWKRLFPPTFNFQ